MFTNCIHKIVLIQLMKVTIISGCLCIKGNRFVKEISCTSVSID